MKIRMASCQDVPAILKIIDAAKAYFKQQQIDQWQNGYPNRQSIMEDVADGHSFVLCEGQKVIAVAAVILADDPNYAQIENGQWLTQGPYGVIHRIACDPDYKGQGLASLFIEYAKTQARLASYVSLRIDTHQDNVSMQRLIAKNGFVYCGIVYMADGSPRLAYEYVLERENKDGL